MTWEKLTTLDITLNYSTKLVSPCSLVETICTFLFVTMNLHNDLGKKYVITLLPCGF